MAKNKLIVLTAVTVVAIAWLTLGIIRFALNDTYDTHYHANFMVYVGGQPLQFDNPLFYEEVGSGCTLTEDSLPQERAHMHDNVGSVVHVHDTNVTWGHFFNNIDYSVGEFHLETWDDILVESDDRPVRYILNEQEVVDIKNMTIESEDRLLIDIGSDPIETLQERYSAIPQDAREFNTQPDPTTCKGSNASLPERLTNAFLNI